MLRLAGIALALASAAGATPVAITGTSTVGGDRHYLSFHGVSSGFQFGNATSGWSLEFQNCDFREPCDLSYVFYVQQGYVGADFYASDGSTTASTHGSESPFGGPPGRAEGRVTWTATPFTSPPVMNPDSSGGPWATVVVPIVVSGRLRAWTAEELAAISAPFFDYEITGTGTLTAFFHYTYARVEWVDAEFAGYATPVPEPATWFPMLVLGFVWLWRNRKRAARPSPRVAACSYRGGNGAGEILG